MNFQANLLFDFKTYKYDCVDSFLHILKKATNFGKQSFLFLTANQKIIHQDLSVDNNVYTLIIYKNLSCDINTTWSKIV